MSTRQYQFRLNEANQALRDTCIPHLYQRADDEMADPVPGYELITMMTCDMPGCQNDGASVIQPVIKLDCEAPQCNHLAT